MTSFEAKIRGRVKPSGDASAFLNNKSFEREDFSSVCKQSLKIANCSFNRCSFVGMKLRELSLGEGPTMSHYVDCAFNEVKASRMAPGLARFERCTFKDVRFKDVFAHGAEFIECVFSGVLDGAVFFGKPSGPYEEDSRRRANEFSRNDFSRMEFRGVDFRRAIDLRQQILPTGDNYVCLLDARGMLGRVRERYLHLSPTPLRKEVFAWLAWQEELVQGGQQDLFICKDSLPMSPHDGLDDFWRELRLIALN